MAETPEEEDLAVHALEDVQDRHSVVDEVGDAELFADLMLVSTSAYVVDLVGIDMG